MEKRRQKRGTKRRIKKGAIAMLLAFTVWTILSGVFLAKVFTPTVKLFILRDNYSYSQEYSNPYSRESIDESYTEYNAYVNELVSSDDKVVSTYAKQNGLVKGLMLISATVPFAIIAYFIVETHEEEKAAKKRTAIKKRASKNVRKNAVRV